MGFGVAHWYSGGLQAGRPGFDSRQHQDIFFSTVSRLALGPTQPHIIQRVLGALSSEVKRTGCEADHSPSSGAEIKNGGAKCLHDIVLN
jgi:hypothetical protein